MITKYNIFTPKYHQLFKLQLLEFTNEVLISWNVAIQKWNNISKKQKINLQNIKILNLDCKRPHWGKTSSIIA